MQYDKQIFNTCSKTVSQLSVAKICKLSRVMMLFVVLL